MIVCNDLSSTKVSSIILHLYIFSYSTPFRRKF